MYILCLVIPTKVDTSQGPQQNVNWMPTVKAQIKITSDSEDKHNMIQKTHLYHHRLSVNTTCLSGCNMS